MGILLSDMVKKNPHLSPDQITKEQLLDYAFKDLNLKTPLTFEEREEMGRRLIADEPETAVAVLSVSTAHIHERRHFHDWLLSPGMASLTAIRTEVCMNVLEVFSALQAEDSTVIPVPLTRWFRKTPEEKSQLLEMWQSLFGDSIEVRLPEVLNQPDVLRIAEHIEHRYKSIGMLFDSYGTKGLSASAVFEASALSIQTQAVNDFLGSTACNLFLNAMLEQDLRSRYPVFIRAIANFVENGKMLENNALCMLVTWCLLGHPDSDPSNAHPVTRMSHVIGYLKEHGFPDPDVPAKDVFRTLDKACNTLPYDKCLEGSLKLSEIIARYNKRSGNDTRVRAKRAAIEAYEFFYECHRYMAAIFLEDPDTYSKPTEYLDTNLEKWLEPPVRYSFGRPFYHIKRADLHKYHNPIPFDDNEDEDVFLRQYVVQSWKETVDLNLAANWQYLCGISDTLFAEFNRDKPEIAYQRDHARKEGLYLLEVLT